MYKVFAPLVFCFLRFASVGSAGPLLVQESGVWGHFHTCYHMERTQRIF
jgi:hypothetical protein